MIIIYGHRLGGEVDRESVDGHTDYALTKCFTLYGVPLIPMETFWVRDRRTTAIRAYGRSAWRMFARWWGPITAALVAALAAVVNPLAAIGLAPCAFMTWYGFRPAPALSPRERRRRAFANAVYGQRCPPELLLPAMRERILDELKARWGELGRGRSPEDVARHGATDGAEAAAAYMLLALEALTATRATARSLAADADRILEGTIEPVADAGPFRVAGDAAAGARTIGLSLAAPDSPARPARPAPITRAERRATAAMWWVMATLATGFGVAALALATPHVPTIAYADALKPIPDVVIDLECPLVRDLGRGSGAADHAFAACEAVDRDDGITIDYTDHALPHAGFVRGRVLDDGRFHVADVERDPAALTFGVLLAATLPAFAAVTLLRRRRARR